MEKDPPSLPPAKGNPTPPASEATDLESSTGAPCKKLSLLTLAALGVVYGDIGTSPLYALRECFNSDRLSPSPENVLGILSLVFWSLTLIISLKYIMYVLRADNRGEGGILALMALALGGLKKESGKHRTLITYLGLFGAALLYSDAVITPAISVLSAVEGVKEVTTAFENLIIPITIVILFGIFFLQSGGSARLGRLFGPVMLLWFMVLGILGLNSIIDTPQILAAVNPLHGLSFFVSNGTIGIIALSGVFLVVTGGEALFADMGHFGRKPIALGWFVVAMPGLMLNYFGQAALLLRTPELLSLPHGNPFFALAPRWGVVPLVLLATVATIIASQAMISGVFSMTVQAVKLGYLPRLHITHTSAAEMGQVYVSRINWLLLITTVSLVLEFRSSSNLAAAYGISVSGTMLISTITMFFVARNLWKWALWKVWSITIGLSVIEFTFLNANLVKILDGGWFPILAALLVFTVMTTWRRGRDILGDRLRAKLPRVEDFVKELPAHCPLRVPGTAIYMNTQPNFVPPALLYNFRHNKVIHELILIVIVMTEERPRVTGDERMEVQHLGRNIHRVVLHYGFMDSPNVPRALRRCDNFGIDLELGSATFFLGRETIRATKNPGMALWREELFALMSRNAHKASRFFNIRSDQVIEIGYEVEM